MSKIKLFNGALDVLCNDDYQEWVDDVSKALGATPEAILFTTSDDDSEFCEAILNKMFKDSDFEKLDLNDHGFAAVWTFNRCDIVISYEAGLQVIHFKQEDLESIQNGYDSM